jgi:hypothetical protein
MAGVTSWSFFGTRTLPNTQARPASCLAAPNFNSSWSWWGLGLRLRLTLAQEIEVASAHRPFVVATSAAQPQHVGLVGFVQEFDRHLLSQDRLRLVQEGLLQLGQTEDARR